jgi:cell division septation protein DedD
VAPEPTRAPTRPPATVAPPSREGFWVQVLAVRTESAVREARRKLEELGFPRDHQWVVAVAAAGGDTLYKLRVGPFPDRDSADRVVRRMAAEDFPDAWVVTP